MLSSEKEEVALVERITTEILPADRRQNDMASNKTMSDCDFFLVRMLVIVLSTKSIHSFRYKLYYEDQSDAV